MHDQVRSKDRFNCFEVATEHRLPKALPGIKGCNNPRIVHRRRVDRPRLRSGGCAARLAGFSPFIEACLGYAYARAGDRPCAEQILARLRTRALTAYVSPIDLAQ